MGERPRSVDGVGAPSAARSSVVRDGLLDDQVAVVGGSGLGRAIALELAALGRSRRPT